MKKYIGTKVVLLKPMTRGEYNTYRGWVLPVDENGSDEGYLVEYTDGGTPNVIGHAGYVSWSPKDQADKAYRPLDNMSFGMAIEAAKLGRAVARKGWNGSGMFAYIVPAAFYAAQTDVAKDHFGLADKAVPYNAYWAIKCANGTVSTWAPSNSDSLADDWYVMLK